MTKEQIIDYVMNSPATTPWNTNISIFKQLQGIEDTQEDNL